MTFTLFSISHIRFILPTLLVIFSTVASAQNILTITVSDAHTGEPLPGASGIMRGTDNGASANSNGLLRIENIPDGRHTVELSFVGYENVRLNLVFPLTDPSPVQVRLTPEEEELEEIVITSTRSSRTIVDIPTRVEFIAGEELDEKANMKPGDIRMLLSESTGIQTQQTSATSANASIRIQGLDGRYTQILKDGFPLYAGFSGGLGLLQTPPLDLQQVEVIKGSTSTLYGGGAIAGLVNLVSRTPSDERELRFLINGTSARGLDLSGFYGKQFGAAGITVFASRNSTRAYDPADIGLSAIPKVKRYTLNPRVFLNVGDNTSLNAGVNLTTEDRIGGDMSLINGSAGGQARYYEENNSNRISTQFALTHNLNDHSAIHIKNSFNHFDRELNIPGYSFDGLQKSTFTELNYATGTEDTEWIAGLNLWTDQFTEEGISEGGRDYSQTTWGAFIQNTHSFTELAILETGLRSDYVVDYGWVLLPRISFLYKASPVLSTRVGGGFGYKTPTIFTEDTERLHFRNVLPVSSDGNTLEKSYGANWDINYRASIGSAGISINHLFFYTYLDNPLTLTQTGNDLRLVNLDGFTDSKGTETNVKIELGDFKLFLGYTFTDTRIHKGSNSTQNPLTPRHRMNNVLMYEVEEQWKIGLEAYYFGRQRLSDNAYGKDYWICGFMVERLWEHFSLFINFENFLDSRQTRFDSIYTGTLSDPVFREIYAPVDGFVINGGLKLDL